MPTTSRGYPYSAMNDQPDGATQIQALAQSIDADVNGLIQADAASGIVQAGDFLVKFTNSPIAIIAVTFPKPFSAPPKVVCDVQPFTNNTPLTWGKTALTATGFTLYVRTVSGGSITTAGLAAQYIAVGKP